jgi:Arc/MetJ family transcription regulator
MAKRLIDVDDELLAQASRELGTQGVADTVRAALRHAAEAGARTRQLRWLIEGGLASLTDPEDRTPIRG